MANPFKTPEFKALFEKWNQILEAEGHKEIEDFTLPDVPLKAWHNLRWKKLTPDKLADIKNYYEKAAELLKTFTFRSELHRRVWELHCEGMSVRKIASMIQKKKFTKTTVHVIIVMIENHSGLRND